MTKVKELEPPAFDTPASALTVNDVVLFAGPDPSGEDEVDMYVVTVVNPVMAIFQGVKAKDKTPVIWTPVDLVKVIPELKSKASTLLGS